MFYHIFKVIFKHLLSFISIYITLYIIYLDIFFIIQLNILYWINRIKKINNISKILNKKMLFEEIKQIPPITRSLTLISVSLSILNYLDVINEINLVYNW